VIFPAVACQLCVEARSLPLAADAGGDIHDALVTPFGVRLLIGDVMGTGVPASQTGAQVLAAWRELAIAESSLPGIAVRLHTLITRSEHPERFVTALLAGFGCGGADMVCCGHPPPLLLRAGTASFVETFPAPPLGLLDLADGWCKKSTVPFGAGDALLMYTDGVTEARDSSGTYFPLAERATRALQAAQSASTPSTTSTASTPSTASTASTASTTSTARGAQDYQPGQSIATNILDDVLASLRIHMGDRQGDDILMLLAAR
jgi:serine phosphatase RsbU (regulator of sigma subunit)